MNNKTTLQRSLLTTGITLALGLSFGLSQNALADSANDDLEVKAGLTQALTLSCDTALSFGITRLGTLERGGITTIAVDLDDDITVGGDDEGVTAGQGQAGECVMSGSSVAEDTAVTVGVDGEIGSGIPNNATVDLVGNASAFSGLGAPTAETDLTLTVTDFDHTNYPNSPLVDASGGASFKIGATLSIPATVLEANLGGYQNTISISVDDGFSEGG